MRLASPSVIADSIPDGVRRVFARRFAEILGLTLIGVVAAAALALATWSTRDPSINHATSGPVRNLLGFQGAIVADLMTQIIGLASLIFLAAPALWGWRLIADHRLDRLRRRMAFWLIAAILASGVASLLPAPDSWPLLPTGLGGMLGDRVASVARLASSSPAMRLASLVIYGGLALLFLAAAAGANLPPANVFTPSEDSKRVKKNKKKTPLKNPKQDEEFEPQSSEGAGLSLGALLHVALFMRGLWGRQGQKSKREPILEAPKSREELSDEKTVGNAARTKFRAPDVLIDVERPLETPPNRPTRMRIEPRLAAPSPNFEPQAPKITLRDEPDAATMMQLADHRQPASSFDEADDAEPKLSFPSPSRGPVAPEKKRIASVTPMKDKIPLESNGDEEDDRLDEASAEPHVTSKAKISDRSFTKASPPRKTYVGPALKLLSEPKIGAIQQLSPEALEHNARLLEGVLEDFGVRGEIIHVRPGPVVTLYELEPAPGVKSSRVIGLADDIARSMSAVSARVAVVQGRNVIGVELPNADRETVYLRELVASSDFETTKSRLAIALGKTIGGESVIVDLAKMPHLLVAGTTGSGKSVAINTMILSLLYRLKPEECRLIMIDPKMLELSVYDGIPHLLTPVVTDPKKAVVALKWAVREMEDRYKKMSKVGVRNIENFNARVAEAAAEGHAFSRTVQKGFDRATGDPIFEQEEMDLKPLPFIVVIVDEMADLMMVAGKDIEGAIQRLAQMARAAGIHLIMATQRPSVDVITGTIKANFPTRISFQVTSKIDSRTILGEQGAEQLLGQGDMLYMAGGGRISRVHGPFVSDGEVEKVVAHLKTQGAPEYLDEITIDADDADEEASGAAAEYGDESGDLYDRAVAIVLRDRKCSTSYIQRRLSVGYNKAASLVERMEKEGVVGKANHAGKREILVGSPERDAYGRAVNLDEED